MGQSTSVENFKPNTEGVVDNIQIQVMKHTKVFSEIGLLSYDDFKKCLHELNNLSQKCLDSNGKQLVFLVKKGTDTSMIWKATVKIACVKLNPATHQIYSHKFLNLKQFLCVFKTFQSHLESLLTSEEAQMEKHALTVSMLFDNVSGLNTSITTTSSSSSSSAFNDVDDFSDCCICLERKPEVLLPCTHVFCSPCIEQWNTNNKTCPVCCETLNSTDETWVMSEIPGADEISDKICSELMGLAKVGGAI